MRDQWANHYDWIFEDYVQILSSAMIVASLPHCGQHYITDKGTAEQLCTDWGNLHCAERRVGQLERESCKEDLDRKKTW